MYQKLLDLVDQRTRVETIFSEKMRAFANENAVLSAQIEDLKEKEVLAREEALLTMERDGQTSVELDGKVIYRQSRITKSVANVEELQNDVIMKTKELAEIGIKPEDMDIFVSDIVLTSKAQALSLAEKYFKVTGKELEGIAVKETKFIAIKDKTSNE